MLEEFPVDERDVPRVQISPQKLEQWREVAFDEVTRVVSQRNSWYHQFQDHATRDGYEPIATRDNLHAYARSVANSPHKSVLIRASLETTLDAIVYGLYCETTLEQRCALAHLYEGNFLDGAVLHVGATRTRDDPFRFVGVKWVAFRSPAPALVASRDFIYFSYSGTMRDADGQRVLFRMLRSMPMDDVAVTERANNNLVRGKISYLYIYRENGARTEVSALALHATAGSMPSWAVTKTIAFVYPAILNLVTVAEAKLIVVSGFGAHGQSLFASTTGSSSNSSTTGFSRSKASAMAASCGVCFRRFRLLRSKRTCRGCRHFMCKSCTVKLCFYDAHKERSVTGVMPLRFCLNCMVQARRERQEVTAHMLRHDSATSSLDLDDNFDALDVSIYRETLRTKNLDVLSDDDDDDLDIDDLDIDDLSIDDLDIDDIDDIDDSAPQQTATTPISTHSHSHSSLSLNSLSLNNSHSCPSLTSSCSHNNRSMRHEKRMDEPNYSIGESFEGTSLMSSNPSLLLSNASFVSSVSSTDSSALHPSMSTSSLTGLLSYSSDVRPYANRGTVRSGTRLRLGSAPSGLKRTASMTPQQADDLAQTFRLRTMLFPDETNSRSIGTTTTANSSSNHGSGSAISAMRTHT